MGVADKTLMKTGDSAPNFNNLLGVDGKKYGLSDFSKASVLAVVFGCNHCPYVQAYEDRLIALQKEFLSQGVQFVAINSNDADEYPEDSYKNMVKRSHEKKFNFPYLRDEDQSVAKAYGATHTPQLFVFDSSRKLAYTGKVDDNWQEPEKVKRRYLHEVLAALVQNKKPAEAATFAVGCSIKWKR